jgi:dihydroxyacetone kinase-like protein
MELSELVQFGKAIASSIKTMGVALTPCTVPALGQPTFSLGPTEMEVGLGIHGEHGIRKEDIKSANEVAEMLVSLTMKHIQFSSRDVEENKKAAKRVVVLVNDLGSLTQMELFIVSKRVLSFLRSCTRYLVGFSSLKSQLSLFLRSAGENGVIVERIYVGEYLTSLEMSGVSISLLPVSPHENLLNLFVFSEK